MTQYADSIEFGGESFVAHTQSNLFPPMGSGAYASAGAGHAAFQSSIIYFDLSFHIFRPTLFTSNDSSCFSIQCGDQNCDTFLFGGPGGNSC